MGEIILRMQGIQKYFPGVHALDNAQLEVREGEVMALVGENGAGKSTLMKILTGIYQSDGGTIEYFGKEVHISDPRAAQALGICIVHQELNLMQHLSVSENIFIGREPMKGPFVNDRAAHRHAQDYVEKIRTKTPSTRARVGSLSGGNQQKVVISKWLLRDCDVLIFDEPTRGIDVGAKSEIYKLMSQLAEEGKSIIMISSDMPELLRMSDRVVVMCEGRVTGEMDISEASQEAIMTFATKREVGE